MRIVTIGLLSLGTLLGAPLRSASGQTDEHTNIKWWQPLVVSGAVAALFAIDRPVRNFVQDNQTETLGDMADVAKQFKEPEVFAVATGALLVAGLVSRQSAVARTGLQVAGAYGLSSALFFGAKWIFGRSRPSETDDVTKFDFLNGTQNSAFPSGSAAVTFSLATTLADAIDHPAASVVAYTAAAANSWSRVYGNRHWVSDVALAAAVGISSAKVVNGRWRIFGIRPPSFLIGPRGEPTLGWKAAF